MAAFVVDASSMVEYFLGTPAGLTVAGMIEGARLIAPEVMDAEVMSTLRGHVLNGKLEDARAERIIGILTGWPVERISHRSLALLAWRYYRNVTAYDAFYVAAALVSDLPLLTSDGRLARAPNLDVEVRYVPVR